MANCFGPIKYLCDVIHVLVLAIAVAVCANHLIIFYGGEHLWLIFCFRWGCARLVQICRITKHSKELSTRAIYDIENNMQSFKVTKTTCQMVHRAHPTNQFNQPAIVFARMREREGGRKRGETFFVLFIFCQYHNLCDPEQSLLLASHGRCALVKSFSL